MDTYFFARKTSNEEKSVRKKENTMEQNLQEEKRIRRVNRELKYQGAIVDVYSDTIETPDGNIAYWDYVEHRK